jgi:hypothetical protein
MEWLEIRGMNTFYRVSIINVRGGRPSLISTASDHANNQFPPWYPHVCRVPGPHYGVLEIP